MISVSIMINGNAIMARSAVNTGVKRRGGYVDYKVDDGTTIHHRPSDGAVSLAHKLLDTIKECGPSGKPLKRSGVEK